ncbi:MAG: T9SS type A sorting domain-containing protein [Candidatus Eisenbacteria bacterium]|nr:T9SS type A sorting domain-containing protein [Candidatus Eisenbacteria bacterium]
MAVRLRTFIIAALMLAMTLPAFAEQRTVLLEKFTNTACPSCGTVKDTITQIVSEYGGQVNIIKYHVNWPAANDEYYLYNPVEITTRRLWYGVNYVPTIRWDGKYIADPSDFGTPEEFYSFMRSTLDSLVTLSSPVRLNVNHWRDNDSLYVGIDVVVTDTLANPNMNLFWAVKTSWMRIAGIGKYHDIFRDFVPNTTGEPLTLAFGDSLHFDWSLPVDSALNLNRYSNVVFLQRTGTKSVVQSWGALVPDPTDVAVGEAPIKILLDQNAPNPFNPLTTIRYTLNEAGPVRLSVYSPAGRLVTDLVHEVMGEGPHAVTWNGKDRFGHEVGSGVYYYRLDADKTALTRKMVLIR